MFIVRHNKVIYYENIPKNEEHPLGKSRANELFIV